MEHYYIYCLHNEDLPEYYVGHTVNLYHRWHSHKTDSKNKNSKVYKYIRNNGGADNFKMEVLDEIYCDVYEARKLERYYVELLGATLNTEVPSRTLKEYHSYYMPNYYENNKEKLSDKNKIYRENNKDKIAAKNKEWYENNKEHIYEKKKVYYENNKKQIAEKRKEYMKEYYQRKKKTH
jgi:hypothetical protein